MVVHFPIAFWIAAAGAWAIGLMRNNETAWRFGLWLHSLGLLGAGVAVALGFWATSKMGHDSPGHELVHVHRDLMLWTTAIAAVTTGLGWWKQGPVFRIPLLVLSLVLVGLLTVGADRGAALVFRYGVGVASEAPPKSGHSHGDGEDAHGSSHHREEHSEGHGSQLAPSTKVERADTAEVPAAAEMPTTPAAETAALHTREHAHGDHEH